ncbi:MAG: exosortase/archaeosortase family protein, partial [Desulfomonilia bacterium]|nr:exosortase/archaeosortase family protein [Desulfomonilia bacterium]
AEACSGIRSLAAFLMLGFLFAYIMQGSYIKKTVMVLAAVPLAFLINIVRVVGTGILANMYGGSVAQGFFHEFSGIVVFIAGFLLYVVLFLILEEKKQQPVD